MMMEVMWEKDYERNVRISVVIFMIAAKRHKNTQGGGGEWESRQKEWRSENKEPSEK